MYRNATTCLMAPVLRKRASRCQSRAGDHDSRDAQGRARQSDGIRHDLVARVRAEIANGEYETEEKLGLALERLLERMPRA